MPVPRLLPELLAENKSQPNDSASLLLVGGVDFGADPGRIVDVAFDRGAARDGQPLVWPPLPGTVAEIADVKAAFAKHFSPAAPLELTGAAATENAVREEMSKCRYLHFSTHGFFAPPKVKSATALDAQQDSTARAACSLAKIYRAFIPICFPAWYSPERIGRWQKARTTES